MIEKKGTRYHIAYYCGINVKKYSFFDSDAKVTFSILGYVHNKIIMV